MDENSLEGFLLLFKKPSWYCATFIIPFLLTLCQDKLVAFLRPKITGGHNGHKEDVARALKEREGISIQDSQPGTWPLLKLVTVVRPLVIFIFILFLLLNLWSLLSGQDKSTDKKIFRTIYTIYLIVACAYNIMVAREETWGYETSYVRLKKIFRMFFIPVTFTHLLLLLYLLINEYFFNLLILSARRSLYGVHISILLFLTFLSLIVYKDVNSAKRGAGSFLFSFLSQCCVYTHLILLVVFFYKTL